MAFGSALDLTDCTGGTAMPSNKPARVKELVTAIDALPTGAPLRPRDMERLRGRLLFSRSLCFGRFGGSALRAVSRACCPLRPAFRVTQGLAQALSNLKLYLVRAPPRLIRVAHRRPPLLFSDGSAEPTENRQIIAQIGAVLLDPVDGFYGFFRMVIPEPILDVLTASGSENIIHQVELIPLFVATALWKDRLAYRSSLSFVDNDGAKFALVAGYSSNPHSCALLTACAEACIARAISFWYERVPSASNIADAPSRGIKPQDVPGWRAPIECVIPASLVADLLAILQGSGASCSDFNVYCASFCIPS